MIEGVAVGFSLVCVYLTARKNILCWLTGIIGILAYSVIFYQHRDWGNFFLQFIFIGQSIWGWLNWKNQNESKISKLDLISGLNMLVGGVILFFTLFLFSSAFNGNWVILDSITTVLSLGGMYLLAKSKLEAWFLWMAADSIYIQFFLVNKLPVSSGLYLIFLILAIYGWWNWTKQVKNG